MLICCLQWSPFVCIFVVLLHSPLTYFFGSSFFMFCRSMVHGPCGCLNSNSPCMVDGKCSNNYPKSFAETTVDNADGYPRYRWVSGFAGIVVCVYLHCIAGKHHDC